MAPVRRPGGESSRMGRVRGLPPGIRGVRKE